MLALAVIVAAATAIVWEVKVSADANFLTKWGTNGAGNGQFYIPYGVAVDASGNVYVADLRPQPHPEVRLRGQLPDQMGQLWRRRRAVH